MLVVVAVVVADGVRTSPLTVAVVVAVKAGLATPYLREAFAAVTVSGACATVRLNAASRLAGKTLFGGTLVRADCSPA